MSELLIFNSIQLFKNKIALCYNGGKDCTVIAHMIYKMNLQDSVCFVRFNKEKQFDEINEFAENECKRMNVELIDLQDYKKGIEELLSRGINVVLMGCRQSDFNYKCEEFMFTDKDWPLMLRIFPILNWSQDDVWNYIKTNHVNYCKLYDNGYTSIGDKDKTKPNFESKEERAGRK